MKTGRYGWNRFASVLSHRCSRRKRVFHHLDIFYPVPCAFSNCLSSIFYELAHIGSMPPREYFLRVPTSYASIKMGGRDKGPPFLADTYFCRRRRFRASLHPWYNSMNFLLLFVIWRKKNTKFILIYINRKWWIYIMIHRYFISSLISRINMKYDKY